MINKNSLRSTLRRHTSILFMLVLIALLSVSSINAQDTDQPTMVVIPGTIQSVLGCSGDWQTDCELTALTYDPDDDLWQGTFDLPAGSYEYKVALDGTWDVNYGLHAEAGGANIPLVLEEDTSVKFVYSHTTHWVADSVNNFIANVPGNYQDEIGCPGEWAPDCLRSLLQDPDGDGIYTFSTGGLAAGLYEAKVALNESWTLNYGMDGARDGANISFAVTEDNQLVEFVWDSSSNIMTINVGGEAGPAVGNLFLATAHWVTADTIVWNIPRIPGAIYTLHYSPDGALVLGEDGVTGGEDFALTYDRDGMTDAIIADFPHFARDYFALKLGEADLARVPELLQGQLAISAATAQGGLLDATSLQIPGVLDDLYTYDGDLGVTWADGIPTIRVWAPTATNVRFYRYTSANRSASPFITQMVRDDVTGVWSITGDESWKNQYYAFGVTVYSPSTRTVETNLVTDPYSFSLSANSTRSQIVDLNDPALFPEGWADTVKPPLAAAEDIVVYELHVRDFSIDDESVPEAHRGTYLAFTDTESAGMQHLIALGEAGLTHIHLLPAFDYATTNEIAAQRQEPDQAALEALPGDSDQQQAIVGAARANDGFNWGYDPLHYTVPEGGYSTDPNGSGRILEFRQMVQALNQNGLRVVMDVVYNHTNSAGQNANAVLDRIVPGYYHRLNPTTGQVESSTCCANTATEHAMMEKLMIDSLLTWATAYRVDGFRFDLMGHHMVSDMVDTRQALDALTLETDGVDGSAIYLYGEGWNFGEVANNARGVNATQLNMGGTGIGTFNDRLRDSVRGGNPFGDLNRQGFVDGLYYDPNETEDRTTEEQLSLLNLFTDRIRVGLAGNLRDYSFTSSSGDTVVGSDIDYNGSPTGYTLDPQEHIVYVSAHDNEILFDAIQVKAPLTATVADRVRMQNLANDIVLLSQGVPFFTAGDDILRSKSMDRNSYDSGDWFNAIDWSYESNNWAIGLPLEGDNGNYWPMYQSLLANPDVAPAQADILAANAHFREMLQIRFSSPLFRLQTAEAIMNRVTFPDSGPNQLPGMIVMDLSDVGGEDLDANYQRIVVVINANDETQSYSADQYAGQAWELHPVLVASSDTVVQGASYDAATGTFSVPGRTTAVFVLPQ